MDYFNGLYEDNILLGVVLADCPWAGKECFSIHDPRSGDSPWCCVQVCAGLPAALPQFTVTVDVTVALADTQPHPSRPNVDQEK